jgi:hypothetical protein
MISTIYQYTRQVDLIGNCHRFILKLKKIQLKQSCKCCVLEKIWLKKGGGGSTSAKPHPNPHGNPQSINPIKALQKNPHTIM